MNWAIQQVDRGERKVKVLVNEMKKKIKAEPLAHLDYVSIVDPNDLKPILRLNRTALLALAVFIGKTRLIDNTILLPEKSSSVSKESVL